MSDTPKTDAEVFPVWNDNKCKTEFFVNADYARTLERENAALRAQLAEANQTIEDVCLGVGVTCERCNADSRWCNCPHEAA